MFSKMVQSLQTKLQSKNFSTDNQLLANRQVADWGEKATSSLQGSNMTFDRESSPVSI